MCSNKDKGIFSAKVKSNRKIGEGFYKIVLEFTGKGAAVFAETKPGQFAELELTQTPLHDKKNVPSHLQDKLDRNVFLRRPFSFSNIEKTSEKTVSAEILYCTVGPCSLRMSFLKENDTISVIGVLGNGFQIDRTRKNAILVLGGMGAGPIQHLCRVLKSDYPQVNINVLVGARSTDKLPFEKILTGITTQKGKWIQEFAEMDIDCLVCTNDGSGGLKGYVTEALEQFLEKENINTDDSIIYTCGPEPMLKEISKTAEKFNITCQISMERNMGCGLGICQSCAVKCRGSHGEFVYKLCCKDGPVFDSKEVVFE